MAIHFESEEKEKLQKEENVKAKEENRKPQKVKLPKPEHYALNKWIQATLIIAIIAVVYAATYSISGLYLLIPTFLAWVIWFCMIAVVTIVTMGLIWTSEGFVNFNKSFLAFNESLSNASISVVEFVYKIFPYVSSVFGAFVVAYLTLSIIKFVKYRKTDKGCVLNFVLSIVLAVLYIAAIIFDSYVLINS